MGKNAVDVVEEYYEGGPTVEGVGTGPNNNVNYWGPRVLKKEKCSKYGPFCIIS
jgi:hypothetical protein